MKTGVFNSTEICKHRISCHIPQIEQTRFLQRKEDRYLKCAFKLKKSILNLFVTIQQEKKERNLSIAYFQKHTEQNMFTKC